MTYLIRYLDELVTVALMYDICGDETDDPDMAVSAVCHLDSGEWLAIECRHGDIVTTTSVQH
jgi:hypothetical protein